VSGYLTAEWTDFSVAVVGASAALTGLLFVAVSINIEQILAVDALAGRALSTMILFVVPLLVGILVLVPDQSPAAFGLELRGTGMAAGGGLLWINRPAGRGELEPRWSGCLSVSCAA
jgi:tetrahydromethanopterin S-methyltransferase subunit D